ncbi:MAG: hypothetical protein HY763_15705 [Planctomycetes bacterium]|nr:hypothetical protein [Planctomycetota bacterium]
MPGSVSKRFFCTYAGFCRGEFRLVFPEWGAAAAIDQGAAMSEKVNGLRWKARVKVWHRHTVSEMKGWKPVSPWRKAAYAM